MIKGSTQGFKFTTPYNFNDISNIVAVFSQSNNSGTESAPMPITKYYNKNVTEIDEWNELNASQSTTYYIGTKYYRYDSGQWISNDDLPAESDVSGGATDVYPLAPTSDISKAYKCDKSYYQYNPSIQKWDITTTEPSAELTLLDNAGVDNIPQEASKKTACKYDCRYYKWNGEEWISSTTLAPIEEIPYWYDDDDVKLSELDNTKTYCARETYYKCIDGTWHRYGNDCVEMVDIYAWDDDAAGNLDKSKVYVLKEFYYEYNDEKGDFEKVAANEVYYKYCKTESGAWGWVVIDDPRLKPKIEAVDAGLWVDGGDYDKNTTYVCKNIYYTYNNEKSSWDSTDVFRLPVIEVAQWNPDEVVYDTTRTYMCPTKYYQYNIEEDCWKEVDKVEQPKIETLNYWSDADNRDKSKIYLCGPTYFQYDSSKSAWQTSNKFKLQVVESDTYPTASSDQSKIYRCSPTYYAYDGREWKAYKKPSDVAKNDGFSPIDGEPKSFIVALTAEETMRFNDRYKGRVQVDVYCGASNSEAKNKIAYFPVYPTMIDDVFNYTPSETDGSIVIFDAGKII